MLRALFIGALLIAIGLTIYVHQTDIKYSNPPEYSNPAEQLAILQSKLPPQPYYTPTTQRYGIDVLREYLRQREWTRDYEINVFDCTEMSALLECKLENEGFHTYIVGGKLDNDPHCWLRVEVVPGIYVIVESTTLTVIVPGNARYNKYRETDRYETIYDAWKASKTAYDWWN